MEHYIDLRSDTVTRPSKQMRAAVLTCPLGDDVYHEDPSIYKLEQEMSKLMNKEAALFLVSGTQANLVAMMTHCPLKGQAAILGQQSHINNYEGGGIAAIANVMTNVIPNRKDGTFCLDTLQKAIPPPTEHIAQPKVICMENTVCNCSGAVITIQHMQDVQQIAKQHHLAMHLDGARMANACTALGIEWSEMAKYFDSISICLSKGLGAPMGSMLVGSTSFIQQARHYRKMLGGGMRQAGVMAVQGLLALQDWRHHLTQDHLNCQWIAQQLDNIPGIEVLEIDSIQTNIFRFRMQQQLQQSIGLDHRGLCGLLAKQYAIKINPTFENDAIRLVTHRDVDSQDLHYFLQVISTIVQGTNQSINYTFKDRNTKVDIQGDQQLNQQQIEQLNQQQNEQSIEQQNEQQNEQQIEQQIEQQNKPLETLQQSKIDLRSDTVTLPCKKMRELIANAAVGDDVYQDDHLINSLQQTTANLLGKAAGIFMPSGTMANLIAVMLHSQYKGQAAIIGQQSHIRRWERGNISAIGGVFPIMLPNQVDGTISIQEIQTVLQECQDSGQDSHLLQPSVICLESSHNYSGGRVLPIDYLQQVKQLATQYNIHMHLDGARLLNACCHLGIEPKEYCNVFDTVQICLSKGLGCPVGSVLVGSVDAIHRAWTIRKLLGGNLRQIGGLGAAGLYALQNWRQQLYQDNQNALYLANMLADISQVTIDVSSVQTNIVMWSIQCHQQKLQSYLLERNIVLDLEGQRLRLVVHRQTTRQQLHKVVTHIKEFLAQ